MKYGVLVNNNSKNYGDDIQSLAAMRLLPQIDYFIDREKTNDFHTNEHVKFICNGWFMDHPDNWPPDKNLIPIFISFHVTDSNKSSDKLINRKLFEYYKQFEPIGCRDFNTVSLFKKIGIEAYFSGCLTLTLENKYPNSSRTDEILLVDPVNHLLPEKFANKIISRLIPESIKPNIRHISHYHENIKDYEDNIIQAENLLESYSKAHLIITSRIHAALPAIALGTPVLFIDLGYNTVKSRSRFGGLLNLFHTIDNHDFPFTGIDYFSKIYRKLSLYDIYYPHKSFKFDWENPPPPHDYFKHLAFTIKKKVFEFL
ncbi:MAG: polysaccharide pyruvyl transferase family protein [Deltaproteobacteria bacterium]